MLRSSVTVSLNASDKSQRLIAITFLDAKSTKCRHNGSTEDIASRSNESKLTVKGSHSDSERGLRDCF